MSSTSNCIKSITLSKRQCIHTHSEELLVDVELNKSAVLSVALRNDDRMFHRATPAEAEYIARRRRHEVAHLISRAFTSEIEDAVARLDACALSGETITVRKGGYA